MSGFILLTSNKTDLTHTHIHTHTLALIVFILRSSAEVDRFTPFGVLAALLIPGSLVEDDPFSVLVIIF